MGQRATIWHNPRCSKSRQALALLERAGVDVEVRHYLDVPPTLEELRGVLKALGLAPRDLARKGEAVYGELRLELASDDALLDAMALHPILIERPIVIVGSRAVIGRPPERVESVLG